LEDCGRAGLATHLMAMQPGYYRRVTSPARLWIGFAFVVVAALSLDLGLLHRRQRRVTLQAALAESAGWIALALAFGVWVRFSMGPVPGLEFFTSYIVEKSLSLDNIFLFLVIFEGLEVPAYVQHKVLYYGVAGALVLRGIFVFGGIALISRFHWVLFVFGGILLITAVRMFLTGEAAVEPEQHWLLRAVRRFQSMTPEYEGDAFFARRSGRWIATPLLLALIAVETADILFAVDSVPAVLSITRSTFIAYSSNVFAVLGLRALYFGLADLLPRFRFLRPGLAAILLFTSVKMLAGDWVRVTVGLSLGVILAIVALTVAASLLWPAARRRA
jgi:tellurite resistance protein TerC